jgi:MFS family permease
MTPIQFYMVDTLDASAAQQSVVIGLLSLPWALKIFFGFITDSLPIYGLRRKPYFILGWCFWTLCNVLLAIIVEPSLPILALMVFLMTCGFVQADVCTDAILVERSKAYEDDDTRGTLQAKGYTIRFFGAICGALAGAVLYNQDEWGWGVPIYGIFLINGLIPIISIGPYAYDIVETQLEEPPPLSKQIQSIWELVQRKAVWKPCTFIFIYNMFFVTNPAWNSFLVDGLNFSEFELGMLTLTGTILSFAGIVVYKKYLFNVSWRFIYLFTSCVAFIFSGLQLMLVLGGNDKIGLGSPAVEVFFAMGSYGVQNFVQAIQFLPATRMFLVMCPEGAEGASYAMLTTLSNLAGTISYSVAAALALIWDVSSDTLSAGNTMLTTFDMHV